MDNNEETLKDNKTSGMDELLEVQNQQLELLEDIHKMIRFFNKVSIILILLATIGYALWLREILF